MDNGCEPFPNGCQPFLHEMAAGRLKAVQDTRVFKVEGR